MDETIILGKCRCCKEEFETGFELDELTEEEELDIVENGMLTTMLCEDCSVELSTPDCDREEDTGRYTPLQVYGMRGLGL